MRVMCGRETGERSQQWEMSDWLNELLFVCGQSGVSERQLCCDLTSPNLTSPHLTSRDLHRDAVVDSLDVECSLCGRSSPTSTEGEQIVDLSRLSSLEMSPCRRRK